MNVCQGQDPVNAVNDMRVIEKTAYINGIGEIENFPEATKLQLFHCILSHHGSLEHGSPVVPMTREAMVLYYADELDSKLGAFDRIEKKDKAPGKEWSEYVNLLDRFLYLGKSE